MYEHKGQTYYQLLGVSQTASSEEIKRAYRALAKKHHPDANKESKDEGERFKEITEAYKILSDKEKKREYDQRLNPPLERDSRQYKYARASSYRYKPSKGSKYREERFLNIFFRAAIYSIVFILILSVVLYLYESNNIQPEDYFAGPQGYGKQELFQPGVNETTDAQSTKEHLEFTREELGRDIILELREKEEQKWREQWADEDKYSLQRRFQERRMEETYEMRKQWKPESIPDEQDDEADYPGY